jgi:HEAT repeat protein
VRDQLIDMAEDENPAVRQEAVTALRYCRGAKIVAALELAMRDAHASVREAAAKSLAELPAARPTAEHQQTNRQQPT